MKIGIFGDVHGNLAGLEAVLAALQAERCEKYLCTGDLVGYGPHPGACIRRVRELGAACVLGNHDEYATDILGHGLERLEPDTRQVIEWTRANTPMEDLKWLAALPRHLHFPELDLEMAHGSLGHAPWAYLVNVANLTEHFSHQKARVCIVGHSHLPLLCHQREGHPPTMEFLKSGVLPPDGKVVFNPGAVGQPRDRDPRAAACVLDTAAGHLHLLRVGYDIAAVQADMQAGHFPERFIQRIALGK
ncbi:MAG: metallophosphoesterase family protein [Lentisphaeria bacterium]